MREKIIMLIPGRNQGAGACSVHKRDEKKKEVQKIFDHIAKIVKFSEATVLSINQLD